ncbi:alanine--tRNA ligase, mitochondrial [Aedes albopictus]|uniref:Alanine--tRNA ligase n=1 Tax=Aedes albopictus TaxID=7160 RepID=A0ABM1YSA2_AEDAL|nr:hypothetical protein RP20_CCG008789 [Aedes albopictus]
MFFPFLRAPKRFSTLNRYATRLYGSNHHQWSSNRIRQQFVDYFVGENGHRFVRSSSVVPFSDPTIAFVNAGMNQFKNVFLGTAEPPCPRAVNSQKCIRVGGKHNDVSVVGSDGYHHTFFEMLGNWSFGDYFKREACEMAWRLLTEVYGIDRRRLYVSYFGGDETMGLPADLECRDVWAGLGIPPERIIPFGARDNFWEMGNSGPCGPCTEIHIDHSDRFMDTEGRKHLVNAGVPDLTEVWNIVFIQYNRSLEDGRISDLPQRHVDTGLGLERLVAHLQNKNSNYDTDLFVPIFNRIQKVSKKNSYQGIFDSTDPRCQLDTAYRIVADHSRMITACLSDGMFPSQNHKLRRILRRSLSLSERIFSSPSLLQELIPVVVDILGATYTEMHKKQQQTLQIIQHEEQSYRQLCADLSSDSRALLKEYTYFDEAEVTDHPGLPYALREIKRLKTKQGLRRLDGEMIHKMYDTYGLDEDLLVKIGEFEQLELDIEGYGAYSKRIKEGAKLELATRLQESLNASHGFSQGLNQAQHCPTRNEYKYNYVYNADKHLYEIPMLKTKITSIVTADTNDNALCHVITEKSNFYFESGGQQSDRGSLALASDPSIQFQVKAVGEHQGFVIHSLNRKAAQSLAVGDEVILTVDPIVRSSNIMHHTATHLLNAAARNVLAVPMCQRSSFVGDKGLKLELAVCGARIGPDEVDAVEQQIRQCIMRNEPVRVRVCNASDVDLDKVTIIPGEVYPEKGLRLVEIGQSTSTEFCCGTHAQSTGELQDFCITNVTQNKSGCYTFFAIAGQAAIKAHQLGAQIQNDVGHLKHDMDQQLSKDMSNIDARMQRLKNVLLVGSENNINLPYAVRQRCLDVINDLYRRLKDHTRESLRELIDIEMKNLQQEYPLASNPFIVHFLESSIILDEVQLSKATRYFPDRPILVLSITDDQVKARATVPPSCVNEHFDAQKWLRTVGAVFKSGVAAPKGQNPAEVCNMKSRKVKTLQFESLLERALKESSDFARVNMK